MSSTFNPLNYPVLLREPRRLTDVTSWHSHIPFAFALVSLLSPALFVELGTHKGDSYFAFCQAVDMLDLPTLCFAIDTWQGDEHAGYYDDSVYHEVDEYNSRLYAGFSTLVRSTFDDAIDSFRDKSVDLLHIDGLHTYEAVSHDFNAWLPKLSERGVVILHDVNVRDRGFGVRKFWHEVCDSYPTFQFTHGYGLGLVAVGTQMPVDIRCFFDGECVPRLRRYFNWAGRVWTSKRDLQNQLSQQAAIIQQHQSQLDAQSQEIVSLRAANESFRSQVSEQIAIIHQHESSLDAQAQAVAELQATLERRHNETVASLQHALTIEAQRTADLRSQIVSLSVFLRELEERSKGNEERLSQERVRASIEKQRLVHALDNARAEFNAESDRNNNLEQLLARKTEEALHYQATISTLELRLRELDSSAFSILGRHWLAIRKRYLDRFPVVRNLVDSAHNAIVRRTGPAPGVGKIVPPLPRAAEPSTTHHSSEVAYLVAQTLKRVSLSPDALIHLPHYEDPVVTIAIVTFNNRNCTERCLRSLVLANEATPYEVVIVDNASTDDTRDWLQTRVRNARLTFNDKNVYFANACNQAAALARGTYLLFLNNDTIVLPGFLAHLLEALTLPNVTAAGSLLLAEDASVLEAGSILWQDGSAFPYGRGLQADDPCLRHVRFVDYCSAASLLVAKDAFLSVKGFALDYLPAYYEDTDLQMKLRSNGGAIAFVPFSRVVHAEYSSSGRDRAEALMRRNQAIFAKTWATALSGRPRPTPKDPGALLLARDVREYRVLVIDDRVPLYDMGSGYGRAFQILSAATAAGLAVTLIPMNGDLVEPYTTTLRRLSIEVLPNFSCLAGRGKSFYHFIVLSRPHVATEYLTKCRTQFHDAVIIYDVEALYFMRDVRQAIALGVNQTTSENFALHALQEASAFRGADMAFVVSKDEEAVVKSLAPHLNTVYMPNAHAPVAREAPSFEERSGFLFVGGFLSERSPNEDGILFFLTEVWPRIESSLVGATLVVVGANPPATVRRFASDRIRVTGFVPAIELERYYARARVVIAPIRFGAGQKFKVTEAIVYGVPMVTTTVGAEGTGLVDGVSALVTDEAISFAQHALRLYNDRDLWNSMRSALLDLAKQFMPRALQRVWEQLINQVAN